MKVLRNIAYQRARDRQGKISSYLMRSVSVEFCRHLQCLDPGSSALRNDDISCLKMGTSCGAAVYKVPSHDKLLGEEWLSNDV